MNKKEKEDKIRSLKEEISELENSCDLLDGYSKGFSHKPKFGRDFSFDEDIQSLIKKWKGTPHEVLIRHMVDSLILFNHNRNQIDNVDTSDKFGKAEVWEAIQLQLRS